MVDEKQVSEIVKNVIAGMDISSFDNKPARKQLGVFDTMEEAIAACNKAYTTFRHYNKEQRENIIKEIRRLLMKRLNQWLSWLLRILKWVMFITRF